MNVTQHAVADAEDHRPMALHQDGESGILSVGDIAVQKLAVSQIAIGMCGPCFPQGFEHYCQRFLRHSRSLRVGSYHYTAGRGTLLARFFACFKKTAGPALFTGLSAASAAE